MPSEKGTVHIIDDDDALRESLAFLLRTARIEVATYPLGRGLSGGDSRRQVELRDHRCAHAGNERHRSAETIARNENRCAGHRHHRPWRRAAGGRGDENRRHRLSGKAVRRRSSAGERQGRDRAPGRRYQAAVPNGRKSKTSWPLFPTASATCSAGWWRDGPTSRSPSISASARARSRSTGPIS